MYPSMQWGRGVCVPACNGTGVYPSMQFWQRVCIPACNWVGRCEAGGELLV